MTSNPWIRWAFAISVGVALALLAFQRATDPVPAQQRAIEEAVVRESRQILVSYVYPEGELQLVDPLAPDRKIGKSYIWPVEGGWEVSGYYRRDGSDHWHPYLMNLDSASGLRSLAVRDGNQRLIGMSAQDDRFSAIP